MLGAVVADAHPHLGRREQPPGLVGADVAHRHAGLGRQLFDRELVRRLGGGELWGGRHVDVQSNGSSSRRSSLPDAVRGSTSVKPIAFGTLYAGNPCRAVNARSSSRIGSSPVRQDDGGDDRFPPLRVGPRVDRCVRYRRMLEQHGLDLGRGHVLPAGDDRVGLAPDDLEAPAVVERPEVTGVQPAVGAERPGRHDRAPDEDLIVRRELDLDPGQRPAVGGDLGARLGHAVASARRAPRRPGPARAVPARSARRRAAPSAAPAAGAGRRRAGGQASSGRARRA